MSRMLQHSQLSTSQPPQAREKMTFQDLERGSLSSSSGIRKATQTSSQAVASSIFQINTSVAAFRRLVDAIGTGKDTTDHRQKLHTTRQRILVLVKETSAKLKALSESDRSSNIPATNRVEDAKLAKDFSATLKEFQKVQQLSAQRESTYMPSTPPSSSLPPRSNYEEDDQETRPFIQEQKQEQKRGQLQLLGNEISFNEAMIDERDQGIREIEEQIGEVSEIFQDLAVLVHGQGVVIDDIQSHVESSAAATKQGRGQLNKASKSGKKASKWCWWVLGIVVVVVVVLLIVFL